MLCLAQRQYSLLQAANLLTPDMIAEFETLQQLVREENAEPGGEVSGELGPARKAPLAQELRSESSESQPCSASFCQGQSLRCMVWWEAGPVGSGASAERGPGVTQTSGVRHSCLSRVTPGSSNSPPFNP